MQVERFHTYAVLLKFNISNKCVILQLFKNNGRITNTVGILKEIVYVYIKCVQ